MTQRFDLSPSLKAQKCLDSPSEYFTTTCSSPRSIISPIPMIHRKIQNDKRMRERLVVTGYKHFSKVSASGEDTEKTLRNIIRASSLKYIRNLEFDPYLCEKSYMKPFCRAIKKFNNLQGLNLVIRRLDYVNESDILRPYMLNLHKMTKIRFELTKVEKLDDNGIIKLAWVCGKLYSIKEFEQIHIGMDHISEIATMHFKKYGDNLRACEKFKKVLQKSTFIARNDPAIRNIEKKFVKKAKGFQKLKDIACHLSMPQGWLSMTTEFDESSFMNLKMIAAQQILEKISFQFSGNPVTLETIQGLSEALPALPNLHTLTLDFLNSRVSENEVVMFSQMLPQLKALERLYFRVIQYPNVSEGCICYLLSVLSKLPNIKHFQIYFRRYKTWNLRFN